MGTHKKRGNGEGTIFKREINGKEIPLKYKHKTFCENKKTISITKK